MGEQGLDPESIVPLTVIWFFCVFSCPWSPDAVLFGKCRMPGYGIWGEGGVIAVSVFPRDARSPAVGLGSWASEAASCVMKDP
jgi:hypothetical protein